MTQMFIILIYLFFILYLAVLYAPVPTLITTLLMLTIEYFAILFTVDWIPHCAPFPTPCDGYDDWRARLWSNLH